MSQAAPRATPQAAPHALADRRLFTALLGGATLASIALFGTIMQLAPPLFAWATRYECVLHSTTGIACPTCGATRAFTSLVHGDFAGAFHWNALVTLALIALPALGLLALVAPARFDRLAGQLPRVLRSWWGRTIIVAAILTQIVHTTLVG